MVQQTETRTDNVLSAFDEGNDRSFKLINKEPIPGAREINQLAKQE